MISLFKVHMPQSVEAPVLETLRSGFIGQGPKVEAFESKIKEYFDHPYPLTLNCGTSGLHLALRLANVGLGDEVITTPMTCTATNMPILASGAKIVFADIDTETGNILPSSIAKRITEKTKAIMIVHWGGGPCDIEEINDIAKTNGLKVIEDAAHAMGAEYKGRKLCGHSDYVMFSLQAIKHISTIDGGILFCKDEADYKRGKLLRWYGIDRETNEKAFQCEADIKEWGYKYHMNDVCAAIGIEQFKYIDGILEKNRANADFYDKAFTDLQGVRSIKYKSDRRSAYWLYTIHVDRLDPFMKFMKEKNVMVSQVHARNDIHTIFKPYVVPLPNTDTFVSSMVSIPGGWWITADERQYIADSVAAFAGSQ